MYNFQYKNTARAQQEKSNTTTFDYLTSYPFEKIILSVIAEMYMEVSKDSITYIIELYSIRKVHESLHDIQSFTFSRLIKKCKHLFHGIMKMTER